LYGYGDLSGDELRTALEALLGSDPRGEAYAPMLHSTDPSVSFILSISNLKLAYISLQGNLVLFGHPNFPALAAEVKKRINTEQDVHGVSDVDLSYDGKNSDGGYLASKLQAAFVVSKFHPCIYILFETTSPSGCFCRQEIT
jgi:hypothetical protein